MTYKSVSPTRPAKASGAMDVRVAPEMVSWARVSELQKADEGRVDRLLVLVIVLRTR